MTKPEEFYDSLSWFEPSEDTPLASIECYDRLLTERDELSERLTRLKAFFETKKFLLGLSLQHQVLLYSQSGLMQGYLNILNKRIELMLTPKEGKDHV